MAYNHHSFLAFAFIINILFSSVGYAIAGRDAPVNAKKKDKKQPEFLHYDGTVLVPGFGHYMHFKKWFHCFPFKYNPITSTCGGTGQIIPGRGSTGSGGGTDHGFVPGGDDTFAPSPSVEVPSPENGGNIPTPSHS